MSTTEPKPRKSSADRSNDEPVNKLTPEAVLEFKKWRIATSIDLLKWAVGTIIIGCATSISTYIYQDKELEIKKEESERAYQLEEKQARGELIIKQLEADSKLIEAISNKFDSSSHSERTALYYYNFIKPFITSEQINTSLDLQIARFSNPKKKSIDASNSVITVLANNAKVAHYVEVPLSVTTITSASSIAMQEETEIKNSKLNQRLVDSLLRETLALSKRQLEDVNNAKENMPFGNNEGPGYTIVGSPEQSWFKPGYFLQFDNKIRIGLIALDPVSQNMEIKITDINNRVIPGYENVLVALGQSCTVDYAGFHYVIDFDFIGAAGKNPFTKAAYISATTYKINAKR